MLVQRSTLEQHRLIIPVSITKPVFESDSFQASFSRAQYRALVDTGAQRTVLSREVIAEQNLTRVGHMEFASLHGSQTHSRFLACIGLWARRVDSHAAPIHFNDAELTLFSIEEPLQFVDMADNVNFDLILGFDVLKRFTFSFDAAQQMFDLVVQP